MKSSCSARRKGARGLTVIEVVAVLVVLIALGLAAILVINSPRRVSRVTPRAMSDMVQVRGIQQSMAIWANQNNGLYPLPSMIDKANTTVAEVGAAKDTTANILSVLIYTGGIAVEMCISPAEAATNTIEQDADYQFDAPTKALDPANALWDPAFAADFTVGKGNVSYAHVMPGGPRSSLWKDSFSATEPVVGNRGPEISAVTWDTKGKLLPTYVNPLTNTFLIHGSRTAWEGNIAYSDGHVNLETNVAPEQVTYKNGAGKPIRDCLFFDEPDDAAGLNAYMSIWTKAGSEKKDFGGIWD